jgi:hypothetical protein
MSTSKLVAVDMAVLNRPECASLDTIVSAVRIAPISTSVDLLYNARMTRSTSSGEKVRVLAHEVQFRSEKD